MTRAEAEILIENEKQVQSALVGITSTSKVSVWATLKYVFASLFEIYNGQAARWQSEIEALVATRRWATVGWYVEMARKYQHGDMLVINADATYSYATTDTTKQVIAQAAIDVVDRELRLKVAGLSGGELAKVPDEVMLSFKPYIEQIKRPGTIVRYTNADADLLRISLKIWFDGELIEATLLTAIKTAVKTYLKSVVFNGQFSVTKLIDHLQAVAGVNEVQWVSGSGRSAEQNIADATPITARYRSASGWFKIDTISDVEQLEIELVRES